MPHFGAEIANAAFRRGEVDPTQVHKGLHNTLYNTLALHAAGRGGPDAGAEGSAQKPSQIT